MDLFSSFYLPSLEQGGMAGEAGSAAEQGME